jgi:uncharacterized glyoxalase superfamily protein PhnB
MQSPLDAGAATMGVFIDLDVVDKHYAVAKAACADIVDSPKTVEYGGTYSAVDPKGHPWFFTEPKAG